MDTIQTEIEKFCHDIENFHIPRWDELPDMELYMDQVITFIENNISFFSIMAKEKIITPSMVNNYVKLELIPKPVKKRYNKTHLAYLIAISILKYVFTIGEIKDGILFQSNLNGEKQAYNSFCEEQEKALKYLVYQINSQDHNNIPVDLNLRTDNLAIKMATLSFASKIIAERIIELQKSYRTKVDIS
ncbi:MAG: DUF1836 domain-containing protein [Tissierellia bacterium]|jgi:hypothetical protein|nr:DUF1836 domain-containing protein [Tissierellia bacterium]